MDSWGSLRFSSSFTEYSQCYSNLPTTPSCIGNETPTPNPPHPREIAHLYTQPADKHSSRAPKKKKKIIKWDLLEIPYAKQRQKQLSRTLALFRRKKKSSSISKSKTSSDNPLKEVASVALQFGSALCLTVNVKGMGREPNLRSS